MCSPRATNCLTRPVIAPGACAQIHIPEPHEHSALAAHCPLSTCPPSPVPPCKAAAFVLFAASPFVPVAPTTFPGCFGQSPAHVQPGTPHPQGHTLPPATSLPPLVLAADAPGVVRAHLLQHLHVQPSLRVPLDLLQQLAFDWLVAQLQSVQVHTYRDNAHFLYSHVDKPSVGGGGGGGGWGRAGKISHLV